MGTGMVSTGTPTRLRSFDPVRLADLEYRAWTGYYLRKWPQVLRASFGLVRLGFGMDLFRTVHGAWLVLRANQLWAPYPDNHPKRARACMRRFYGLVRLTYGEPSNPAKAAELEVDWWRVHRELQHEPGRSQEELVDALVRLYTFLYGDPEEELRPAAVHRAKAMELSDQWVEEGCQPGSELLPLEHAALIRAYAALLVAVHH
jgi:hypothetical protein